MAFTPFLPEILFILSTPYRDPSSAYIRVHQPLKMPSLGHLVTSSLAFFPTTRPRDARGLRLPAGLPAGLPARRPLASRSPPGVNLGNSGKMGELQKLKNKKFFPSSRYRRQRFQSQNRSAPSETA
jgi:hypothetical protein